MKKVNAVLKNIQKYREIKLARGIDLGSFRTVKRKTKDFDEGISMQKYAHQWFVLPSGKAIFKSYDGRMYSDIRLIRVVNEMLCYKLAQQTDVECAKYEPATIDGESGLVSYNVLSDNEEITTLHELLKHIYPDYNYSIEDVPECLDKILDSGKFLDKSETIFNLFKMMVFDTVTMQSDRHENNVHFIYNKKAKFLSVAPLIDNELAFSTKHLNNNLKLFNNEILEKELVEKYAYYSHFLEAGISVKTKEIFNMYSGYGDNVYAIAYLSVQNERYGKFVKNFLKNINVKQAFAEMQSIGYEIPQEYMEYVETIVEIGKKSIRKAIKYVKQNFEDDYGLDEVLSN